jgi:hypothetical protein
MKSKTNQLTLIYIYTVFLAIVFHKLSLKYFQRITVLYFLERPYCSFTGITFRYILSANDNRNRVILKTQENNDEIKESNEI